MPIELDPEAVERVRATNWLRHRWNFKLRTHFHAGQTWHLVHLGPLDVSQHETRELARGWIERTRPISLEAYMHENPEFRAGTALIEGTPGRLARIPRPMWGSYDVIPLFRQAKVTSFLSAKARALFPGDEAVFLRMRL